VEGQERIVLHIEKVTTRIALNIQAMNITGLNLHIDGEILTGNLHTEHEKNIAYFSFQRPLNPGECILELSFRYHMRQDSLAGVFLAPHTQRFGSRFVGHGLFCHLKFNHDFIQYWFACFIAFTLLCGLFVLVIDHNCLFLLPDSQILCVRHRAQSKFLATYFDPFGARMAFPCFDEPHFKANFTFSIVTPDKYVSLAPTQESDVTHLIAGGKKVHFAPSIVPISPHKTGFVIAQLKSIETTTKDGILLRVWAEEGFQTQSRLALRLALDGLDFLTQRLNLSLPIRKLDLVALPDFVEDMHQSSGLCMFDESNIIYDVSLSPATDRWKIATAVWKCLSHHWFSDWISSVGGSSNFLFFLFFLKSKTKQHQKQHNCRILIMFNHSSTSRLRGSVLKSNSVCCWLRLESCMGGRCPIHSICS
jgi:hypothetical protein